MFWGTSCFHICIHFDVGPEKSSLHAVASIFYLCVPPWSTSMHNIWESLAFKQGIYLYPTHCLLYWTSPKFISILFRYWPKLVGLFSTFDLLLSSSFSKLLDKLSHHNPQSDDRKKWLRLNVSDCFNAIISDTDLCHLSTTTFHFNCHIFEQITLSYHTSASIS